MSTVLFAYYGQAAGAGLIALVLLATSALGFIIALSKQLFGSQSPTQPAVLIGFVQTWVLVMCPWPIPITIVGWLLLASFVVQVFAFTALFRNKRRA